MRFVNTLIVGGGPAGSSCARELNKHGHECLVLEAVPMPRVKLCAGWITPKVLQDLEMTPKDYPRGIVPLKKFKIFFGRKRKKFFTLKTLQYSIRRVEFDHWLLQRAGVEVVSHRVKSIQFQEGQYVIDEKFACRHLVGAGGSGCPVRKTYFPGPSQPPILTREVEYTTDESGSECTLWVPYGGKGYAWYVPKADGVNIGFGYVASSREDTDLKPLWEEFMGILHSREYLKKSSPKPSGWFYYLRENGYQGEVKRDRVYVIGDAAGLATRDMGEGIGPAIESGILAARDILGIESYTTRSLTAYSLPGLLHLPALAARPLAKLLEWIV